ncbi:protein methyltransferase HemK [Peptoclostridium acidaminophilum DSM 3953]|uniref:Release factor glutamine methyltransferase n=1 Tax=Peptoclostridium acidaminophilum DSM 3953 TaxID=1286171 RepID=W8TCZ2_PEPAC|nr:protein methyltransferase HemK [Peptoclostridium acidaminophilum DSM 3953]
MKVKQLLENAVAIIGEMSETALLDAQLMLSKALGKDRLYVITHIEAEIAEAAESEFMEMVGERSKGRPLQYIVGSQEFMGLDFYVSEGVLIPRPDTEILVEEVISVSGAIERPVIADIGCGSGAISVSLAKYIKEVFVYSLDISQAALEICRINAENNGVGEKIRFLESDIFSALEGSAIRFDIIVSNPPYIRKLDIDGLHVQVKDYEPMKALDGGTDGLDFYRRITLQSVTFLKPGGYLAYEVGHDQARDVKGIMEASGAFGELRIIGDLAGIERVVIGRKL